MYDSIYIEHYGVKGMKWDESKRNKISGSEHGESPNYFKEKKKPNRPSSGGNSLKLKPDASSIFSSKSETVFGPAQKRARAAAIANKARRGLKIATRQLGRVGEKSARSISSRTRLAGGGAISSVLRTLQRNSK